MSAVPKSVSPTCTVGEPKVVVIDTETTGLNPKTDRIISIGLVEMENGRIGKSHEWFFNPGNVAISPEALAVHGITAAFLEDKPPIKHRLPDILGLLHESIVGGHNVNFDISFLEEELRRNRFPQLKDFIAGVQDTMLMSRGKWPGKAASLDALCDRTGVSRNHRVTHGALTDALLCAETMIVMRREQICFDIFDAEPAANLVFNDQIVTPYADILAQTVSAEELATHQSYLEGMRKEASGILVWDQYIESENASELEWEAEAAPTP